MESGQYEKTTNYSGPSEQNNSSTMGHDNFTSNMQERIDILIVGGSIVKNLEAEKIYKTKKVVVELLKEKNIKGGSDFINSSNSCWKPAVIQFMGGGGVIFVRDLLMKLSDFGQLLCDQAW